MLMRVSVSPTEEESEKYNFYVFYVPDKLNFIESKKSNTYFAVKNIVEKNNVKFIYLQLSRFQ